MRLLRRVAIFLGLVILAVAGVFGAARLHDGPLGPIPGGRLQGGELANAPIADWSFAADLPTIEIQLADESTSRTVWIIVDEGEAFVPCSLAFPPGKSWHLRAVEDGRSLVRIAGKRYPVTLQRIDPATRDGRLEAAIRSKYRDQMPGGEDSVQQGGVWFFSITSRAG